MCLGPPTAIAAVGPAAQPEPRRAAAALVPADERVRAARRPAGRVARKRWRPRIGDSPFPRPGPLPRG
jgi:hypothetical protein